MADPGIVINTGAVPPESETTDSVEQRRKSAASIAAGQAVKDTNAEVIASRDAAAPVENQEALIRQYGAGGIELATIQGANRQAELEDERRRKIAQFRDDDAKQIAAVTKAAKEKAEARVNFWEGNTAGKIFAAFLRGIDRAASSYRGESGPTGTDRIIDSKIQAHENAAIAAWENEKEIRALKAQDHDGYLAELDRKKIEATNQSKAELEALNARVEKYLAGLAPEKAAVARQQWQADYTAAQARLDQKQEEGYDKVTRHAETKRTGGPPTAPDQKDAEKAKALITATANADSALAEVQRIVGENGGIPLTGEKLALYQGAVNRAAKAVALVESGNPESEVSDPTIRAMTARIGPSATSGAFKGGTDGLMKQLDAERAALQRKKQAFAAARPATSVAGASAQAAPKPPAEGERVRFGGKTYVMKGGKPVEVQP